MHLKARNADNSLGAATRYVVETGGFCPTEPFRIRPPEFELGLGFTFTEQ